MSGSSITQMRLSVGEAVWVTTTTGSSVNEWNRVFRPNGRWRPKVREVRDYHEHAAFIDSVVESVKQSLAGFAGPAADVDFLFSAHSLPVKVVEAGWVSAGQNASYKMH